MQNCRVQQGSFGQRTGGLTLCRRGLFCQEDSTEQAASWYI